MANSTHIRGTDRVAHMSRRNPRPLVDRVVEAAEAALAADHSVTPIEVLLRIRLLDPNSARRWQRGQSDCPESAI
jgi:hypothetical protein